MTRLPGNTRAIAAAAAMLVLITGALFLMNDVTEGLGFLYAVPIALVASRFGRAEGLGTALVSLALFASWTALQDIDLRPTAYAVRALTYVFVAVVVGGYAERIRDLSMTHSSLIDSAPDAILSVGQDGRIELANAKASDLFGRSAEELSGMTVEELMPHRLREGHVERRRGYAEDPHTRPMGAGLPLYAVRRDGTEFRVEITLAPSPNRRGSVTAIVRDVTRQKLLEEDLKRAGRFFRVTRDLVCTTDADGRIDQLGSAWDEALGWTRAELTGRPLLDLCHPADRGTVEREFAALADGADGVRFTSRCRRADGDWRWFEWSAMCVPEERTVYAAARDVTERVDMHASLQESRRELKRSNDELEQFARVASHDLSEPLRVIGGFGRLLERNSEVDLGEDSRRYLASMLSGVDRLQSMLDALLAYSRVGGARAARARVDTDRALGLAWEALAERSGETGATLRVDGLPPTYGDFALIGQLFQNLMSNAIKFVVDGEPRLAVECEETDGQWVFSVTDNGPGIPPENAERIFRPFERLHGRETPGTGMGLAICARIVEKHGGRIWVEPGADGGSVFRFTLPQLPDEERERAGRNGRPSNELSTLA
jgi:two-component system sensor kinase FixL